MKGGERDDVEVRVRIGTRACLRDHCIEVRGAVRIRANDGVPGSLTRLDIDVYNQRQVHCDRADLLGEIRIARSRTDVSPVLPFSITRARHQTIQIGIENVIGCKNAATVANCP